MLANVNIKGSEHLLRRIALIGSAPSSVTRAPYDDPSWQIWGCSPGAIVHMRRITRFFELHAWRPENPCCEINYVKRLSQLAVPVYMVVPQPEIPGAVRYPKEQVLDFVWGHVEDQHGRKRPVRFDPNCFASTLSWMLAMAIMELAGEPGQNEIGLWGVDMAAEEEWMGQKDGCLSLIHIAKAIGIRIVLPPESDLIRPNPLYGYMEHDHHWRKLAERENETNARLADSRRRMQSALEETRFLEGALATIRYDMKTWVSDDQALRQMYSQPDLIDGAAPDKSGNLAALPSPEAPAPSTVDRVTRAAAALGLPAPDPQAAAAIDAIMAKIAEDAGEKTVDPTPLSPRSRPSWLDDTEEHHQLLSDEVSATQPAAE